MIKKLFQHTLVERGVVKQNGHSLNVQGAKVKQLEGMEGWVLVTHNFDASKVLGAAYIFTQRRELLDDRSVLMAHLKLELLPVFYEKLKGKPLYPALAFNYDGKDVDKDGRINEAVITAIGLCDTRNVDPEIKPIML
jgi:hypothetical protein